MKNKFSLIEVYSYYIKGLMKLNYHHFAIINNTLINHKIILSSIRLIKPPKVLIGNAAVLSFLSEEMILSLPIREVSLSSITVQMSVQVCPLEQSNRCAFTVMLNCTHSICLTLAFSRGQPLSVFLCFCII